MGLSVAYLCGVLNSELLDLWYALRGRTPWHVRRDYEPKPMNEMPYRHVPRPSGWAPSTAVDALTRALAGSEVDAVLEAAAVVRAAIGSPAGDADALTAVEHLVRAVAANRTALLPLRSIAPELRRASRTRGGRTVCTSIARPSWPRCRPRRFDRSGSIPSSR
jgi:hypothetical protein